MFAYCGNNPVNRADLTGDVWWWIPVVVRAGISFVATLITGGDLVDALGSAAKGAIYSLLPDKIVHIASGILEAVYTWLDGGSFTDGLGRGAIAFLFSYVSADSLFSGVSASDIEKLIVDVVFGSGAELTGNALSEGFFGYTEDASSPFNNNPYGGVQDHMPIHSHSGGGGGCGNTVHLVLY